MHFINRNYRNVYRHKFEIKEEVYSSLYILLELGLWRKYMSVYVYGCRYTCGDT
uniref:Uncharacterized protein n=1 Tax=Octopus bimaculoides TaxID=37653 RepID=A0A0L8HSX0_OCTBM